MSFRNFIFRGALEDNEYIIKAFRRVWLVFVSEILGWVLLIGGIDWILYRFIPDYAWWGIVPITVLGVYKMIGVFSKWYLNTVLMTNENIIIAEWHGFFHKSFFVINYWNLDELQVEKKGIFAFIRNYGDVTFLKLNSGQKYVFRKLANPHKVIREIHNFKETALHEKNFKEESALKELISQMVQTHARDQGAPDTSSYRQNEPLQKRKSVYRGDDNVEYEKELDDFGGVDIDLDNEKND